MPETSVPTPPGFDALSKAEQVRYLQKLWDQISEEPSTLPVPESPENVFRRNLTGGPACEGHSAVCLSSTEMRCV
jgi:hypothetical protein